MKKINIVTTKENNTPYIPIKIEDKTVYVMIDTGASDSLIDVEFFEALKDTYKVKDYVEVSTALDTSIIAPVYELQFLCNDFLFFDDFTICNLNILNKLDADFSPIVGIIGSSFLSKYKAIIDFYHLNIKFI